MSDYVDYNLESVGVISNVFRVSHVDVNINDKIIEFTVTSDIEGDVGVEVDKSNIEYLRENLPSVEFIPSVRDDTHSFIVMTQSFINYIHDFITEALDNRDIY